MKKFISLVICATGISLLHAQISLSPGSTYTQDFNSIGTSQTATLPAQWKADNQANVRTVGNYSSAGTQTSQRAGNNMSNTASNGIYNYAAGDATTSTERAVGGLSSSSGSKSVNIYAYFRNNGSSNITGLNISYNVEKYRNGSNPAGFTIQLYYSTDGSNWTSAGSSFITSFSADGDNNGYSSAPGETRSVSSTLSVTIPPGGDFYLAWNYSVTSGTQTSNAQALGIDDVQIEALGSAPPTLFTNVSAISGLSYVVGNGPSASQMFSVWGNNLTPSSGNITITAPTNFEISLDNSNFSSSLMLTYNSSTLSSTNIYVRLAAGLSIGYYNGNITISGGGASTVTISVDGTVTGINTFTPGDFAVLSVCSNTNCQGTGNGDDEISFITFTDIVPGTEFIITDNGYQRTNANQWGNSEGTYKITRTGSTIPAGTVITIRLHGASPYFEGIYPDNNWSMTNLNFAGTSVVLNSNGDQLYFMQGGTWNKGTSNGSHDATYTPGVFLFAFNTNNVWQDFANSTQHSGLVPGMECFSMMPGVATDFIEYTGPTTPATKREWIDRINNPSNWTNRSDCNTYFANRIHYGITYTILSGGFSPGVWLGSVNSDWFNCRNWQNLEIPDSLTDVVIPSTGVTNEPVISAPPTSPVAYEAAYCGNIQIQSGRTLTMNNSQSRLDVYGNFENQGILNFSAGIVNFVKSNSELKGSGLNFYNLAIKKISSSNTLTLFNDVFVANQLNLTKGKISTSSYKVVVTSSSPSAIVNHSINSYIVGNLRRYVASTGSYDFPLGSNSYYELAQINLNSSSGLTYIDGFFTTPHVTPINISSLGLYVNGTLLTELLNYGFWTFTPNAGSYNYDITLTSRGHTNEGPTAASHAVIKRPNSASNWVSEGIHNNSDQSMVSGVYVTAKRRSLTTFSDFAIAKSNAGSLPVELISFEVKKTDNNSALISWQTASETNCHYYRLEKWHGSELAKTWIEFGNGTTSRTSQYTLYDELQPGIAIYKLYQIDFDGTEHFLGIRLLEYELANLLHISQTERELHITGLPIPSTLVLSDALGRTIFKALSTETEMSIPLRTAHQLVFLQIFSQDQPIFQQKLFVK